MKCDKCEKCEKLAIVILTEIKNGIETKLNLCNECAGNNEDVVVKSFYQYEPNVKSMDIMSKLTDRSRKVLSIANQEAQRFNHEYVGTEHILLGLVREGSGVGCNVLKNFNIDLRAVRLEVEKLVRAGPEMVTMGKLPMTQRSKNVLAFANDESLKLKHTYIGTEHLLLGLLRERDGVAAQVLLNMGISLEEVKAEILNLLGFGVDDGKDDAVNEVLNDTCKQYSGKESEPNNSDIIKENLDTTESVLRQLVASVSMCGSIEQIKKATSLLEQFRVFRDQCKDI